MNTKNKPNNVKCGILNARSINNKTEEVVDFILDNKLDVLCVTETWLQANDSFTAKSVTPNGFSIISNPRQNRRGGGVATIVTNDLCCKRLANVYCSTFEALLVQITSTKTFAIATIYRSPGPLNNFLIELGDFISTLVVKYEDFLLTGDFNIHMDNASDESTKKMTALLQNFGLKQHVESPTHSCGHILDLVISKDNTQLVHSVFVAEGISDHHSILVDLSITKQKKKVVKRTFHQFKKLDMLKFQQDICSSELYGNSSDDVDCLASQYHSVVSDLVSIHAPLITRTVTTRPPAPWYTSEIALARQERRRLERCWRRTKLTVDREIFVTQKLLVNSMLHKAKANYYIGLVKSQSDNPKQLWSTINSLSGNAKSKDLPEHDNLPSLVNSFNLFFAGKISQIRANITMNDLPVNANSLNQLRSEVSYTAAMSVFQEMKESDIKSLIKCSPSKSCCLDPIPTYLLQSCETIVSPLTKLMNLSLKTGVVPKCFKHALVTPLIKNSKLDSNSMSSYRPISNLLYVSKLLERCVAKQLNSFLSSSAQYEAYQSAYRPHHSTETALLRVQNDILTSIDNKEVTLLVLLDLSAAFDTVDHTILLNRLKNIGIMGVVYDWFSSYLTGRSQAVHLDSVSSDSVDLTCGVPQGSVLGPILFNIYTQPLGEIARKHGLSYHFYADDTQLYTSFSIKDSDTSVLSVSDCIADIKIWMKSNLLMLNDSKTEVVLLGTKQQLSKLSDLALSVGNANIKPVTKVRNLGVIFDNNMSMENHVNNICKTSYFYIRLLGKLRKLLDKETGAMITHAFVTSRLDYCNSLLYGISSSLTTKLQHILNTAARIVTRTKIGNHITPVLKSLHWLPVVQHCAFKTALLTFKVIHGLAPSYLCELIRYRSTARDLRSINDVLLDVPKSKSCIGSRAFAFSAPKLWNSLPYDIRTSVSLVTFKSKLKTYLFREVFG
jgi:hypothetical protein